MAVSGTAVAKDQGAVLDPQAAVTLENGPVEGYALVLQGQPIAEPIAKYGRFARHADGREERRD